MPAAVQMDAAKRYLSVIAAVDLTCSNARASALNLRYSTMTGVAPSGLEPQSGKLSRECGRF